MENGSLMKVKSIAECSSEKQFFCVLFEWLLKTGLTVYSDPKREKVYFFSKDKLNAPQNDKALAVSP